MKKGFITSIIVLVTSLVDIILYGILAFVFMIAIDLAIAFSGGNASTGQSSTIVVFLLILMLLAVINIVLSIYSMVSFKRNRGNQRKIKNLLIGFLVVLALDVIFNIILIAFTLQSIGVLIFIISALIYILCIILILLQIKAINSKLIESKNTI